MLSPEPKQRAGHTPEVTQVTTQVIPRELPEGLFTKKCGDSREIQTKQQPLCDSINAVLRYYISLKHYAGVDHQMKKTRVVRMLFVYFSI